MIEHVFFEGPVLWSMLDANMHLRHSAYADFAAQGRIALLEKMGFTAKEMKAYNLGPILFREELIYYREVGMNDYLRVTCKLSKSRGDGSRWAFTQDIFRSDNVKAATVNTEGAWLDMSVRKLAALPTQLSDQFRHIPKAENFIED